jgi:AcrR family transcriptional regulator
MPRPRSNLRARILEAAEARFLEGGVDGASLRSIARDAETTIGMVYYYFPTKDQLFDEVVEETYRGLLADFEEILDPDRPVQTRLRGMFGRAAKMNDREFRVIRIILREALVSSERLGRLIKRFSRGHIPLVVAMATDGVRDGVFDRELPLPALLMAAGSLAVVPQLVQRVLRAQAPIVSRLLPSPETLAAATLQILLRGASPSKR